jgi:NADPH-dependent 2,4-dienoyl-CoA reductase/sulfur reductase-like enzyme
VRTIVVAGAGLAGLSAAAELRRLGWDGRLVIIGAEQHRPYRRPPLSKDFLLSETPLLLDLPQADELDADWRLGQQAAGLDLNQRTIRVVGGDDASFDGLVIATGASARQAPPHLTHPRVLLLRGLDDAVTLREQLAMCRRVLVLGAGFLGSEIAAAATLLGKEVTLAERMSQPLLTAVGESVGGQVAVLHRSHGVEVRLQTEVTQLDGAGMEVRAHLGDGSVVETDLVVAALGSRPMTSWLRGSALTLDEGVVLDADGLAAPGVVAAGDVARWPHPLLDHDLVRVEHYSNAVDQGRQAARALLGNPVHDQMPPLPSFWSHQYDWRLQSVGFTGSRFDFTMIDQDAAGRLVGEYHHHGRLIGAIANGRPGELVQYRQQLLRATAQRVASSLG